MLVFGRCRAPNAIHPLVRQARGQRKVQRVVKWPAISKRAYCDPNMYDMMDSTLEHQIEPNDAEIILGQLNSAQRHAVTVTRGKFLVLAGPGSGKTRVICHRIAYLVEQLHVKPQNILFLTFTNRAAKELIERTLNILKKDERDQNIPQMGTFHSLCAKLLRRYSKAIGINSNFVVIDTSDTNFVISQVLADMTTAVGAKKRKEVAGYRDQISQFKNQRLHPEDLAGMPGVSKDVKEVYEVYQQRLREMNGLDYDDLQLCFLELLEDHPDLCQQISSRYEHILVDEWQDTSTIQYQIAKRLASVHQNLFVVGDPDQSIYAWRSADHRNISLFKSDFPDTEVIFLDQNYRSTKSIMQFTSDIILQDSTRPDRRLETENPQGFAVSLAVKMDDDAEGAHVAEMVSTALNKFKFVKPGHIAILYRANFQSRAIEQALRHRNIPYRIIGEIGYYERKEIKDLLSYLRLIDNAHDFVSFERIVNVPTRGIGAKALSNLNTHATHTNQSLWESAKDSEHKSIRGFVSMMQGFKDLVGREHFNMLELIERILDETGYQAYLKKFEPTTFQSRWENVNEFKTVAMKFDQRQREAVALLGKAEAPTSAEMLRTFMEEMALVTTGPNEGRSKYDKPNLVTLITAHSAKGLEWPIVHVVGCHDQSFPNTRSEDLNEERRLFYVACTRAQAAMHLSWPANRFSWADQGLVHNTPSRFITRIVMEDEGEFDWKRCRKLEYVAYGKHYIAPTREDYDPAVAFMKQACDNSIVVDEVAPAK